MVHLWSMGGRARFNELYRSVASSPRSRELKLRGRATFLKILNGLIEKRIIAKDKDGIYRLASGAKRVRIPEKFKELKRMALALASKTPLHQMNGKMLGFWAITLLIYLEEIRGRSKEVENLINVLVSKIREDLKEIKELEPDQKAILYHVFNRELLRTSLHLARLQ